MCELPVKIYGVTSVGPKLQIIIPSDVRVDFNINIGNNYDIAVIDNIAIGLKTNLDFTLTDEKLFKIDEKGEVNIGTKYQFVIPSDIRKQLEINPGDSLIVLGATKKGLGLIKNDNIDFLFNYLKKTLNH